MTFVALFCLFLFGFSAFVSFGFRLSIFIDLNFDCGEKNSKACFEGFKASSFRLNPLTLLRLRKRLVIVLDFDN